MAPQRRGAPKAPEGSGAAERRRQSRYQLAPGARERWYGRGLAEGRGAVWLWAWPGQKKVDLVQAGPFPERHCSVGVAWPRGAWFVVGRIGRLEGRGRLGGVAGRIPPGRRRKGLGGVGRSCR